MSDFEKTETNLLASLGKLRKDAEANRKLEKADNDSNNLINPLWVISYGEGATSYDDDLRDLIRGKSFREHIALKSQGFKDLGISYCVLDLFSPLSSWLSKIQKRAEDGSLPIDGGVAITLDDPRRNLKKIKADERKDLYCIDGDIFKPEPRRRLKERMDKLGIASEGFALVMARPYGGIKVGKGEEEYIPVYYALLQEAWNITSKHDGEIFCPVPESLSNSSIFSRWVKLMEEEVKSNIELSRRKTYMKITKHKESRDKLPTLGELGLL